MLVSLSLATPTRRLFCTHPAIVIFDSKIFFQKSIDKKFSIVVKMRFAQNLCGVFLETKNVIRSSIHSSRTYTGRPTAEFAQLGSGWNTSACPSPDGLDRLQKQNGQNRF